MKSVIPNLLTWYDNHARKLPWRVPFPQKPNPYHTLLSEVMLQQTTIATVQPYFHAFVRRWPTLHDFAQVSLEEVMSAWSGLGYYRRAKALWKTVQTIQYDWQGNIPSDYQALLNLPGIGPYTAASIAAIAFHQPIMPIDGNIYRVVGRLKAKDLDANPAKAKVQVQDFAQDLIHPQRSGDIAQALMDIGATICSPKNPSCLLCPLAQDCQAFVSGAPETYPPLPTKKQRPEKQATAFWLVNDKGEFYLRYRQDAVLTDMLEVPSTPWLEDNQADLSKAWQQTDISIRHVFTHFALTLNLAIPQAIEIDIPFHADEKGGWYKWEDLKNHPVPTLTKKIIKAGLALSSAK